MKPVCEETAEAASQPCSRAAELIAMQSTWCGSETRGRFLLSVAPAEGQLSSLEASG